MSQVGLLTKKYRKKIMMNKKQNIPLQGEVNPQDVFTKLSIFAMRAADKYKLKNFKLETNQGQK